MNETVKELGRNCEVNRNGFKELMEETIILVS